MTDEGGNINAAILTQLSEIKISVGIMADKLNQLPDHEIRIRALEKWKNTIPIAALFALGSAAADAWVLLHH